MTSGSCSSSAGSQWFLGLETSTPQTSICLCSDAGILYEKCICEADSHSESLAGGVRELFAAAGIEPSRLSLILLAAGPGSFTGLRIGYSFAKGLALSLKCPLRTFSSLAAAAYEYSSRYRMLCVMRDARRDELFWEVFLRDCQSFMATVDGPSIISAKDVTEQLAELAAKFSVPGAEIGLVSADDLGRYGLAAQKPAHAAVQLVEIWKATEQGVLPCFDLNELIALEPQYMRAVAAKTIAERRSV